MVRTAVCDRERAGRSRDEYGDGGGHAGHDLTDGAPRPA